LDDPSSSEDDTDTIEMMLQSTTTNKEWNRVTIFVTDAPFSHGDLNDRCSEAQRIIGDRIPGNLNIRFASHFKVYSNWNLMGWIQVNEMVNTLQLCASNVTYIEGRTPCSLEMKVLHSIT
jgi:hypothetical protein